MRPLRPAVLLAAAAVLVPAAPALAHVDVLPTTVVQGEATEFTIRIPNERDIPTTAVRVEFPPQVTVYALATPPPGWRVTARRAADGRLTGVVLRGSLPVAAYLDYTLLGTAFTPGEGRWAAYQTYADGRTKPWTTAAEGAEADEGGPETPGPAAVLRVLPEGSAPPAAGTPGDGGTAAAAADEGSDAGVWLGVIAIVFAAGALLATGFLWTTRPARLPEDDDGDGDGG